MRRIGISKVTLLLLVAFVVASCASTPTESPVSAAPANYKDLARAHIQATFFDPYSLRDSQIAPPKMGQFLIEGTFRHETGWVVCYRGNAKNRMGAYSGIKETMILIRDGRVVASASPEPGHYDLRTNCGEAKYEPFPEIDEKARGRTSGQSPRLDHLTLSRV